MGAQTFITEASGKDAKEAFHNAVEDAFYWNGHGGYTGTIAEKPGFTLFDIPLDVLPEAMPIFEHGVPNAETRLTNAIGYHSWGAKSTEYPWEVQASHDLPILIKTMGEKKWKQMCDLYEDKWENAVAFLLKDEGDMKTYCFMGWASC